MSLQLIDELDFFNSGLSAPELVNHFVVLLLFERELLDEFTCVFRLLGKLLQTEELWI